MKKKYIKKILKIYEKYAHSCKTQTMIESGKSDVT